MEFRNNRWRFLMAMMLVCSVGPTVRAQSHEVQQLLLNMEKLSQMKNILSDMKKGYQVISGGYNAIRDISQGNFSLHEVFLDGLMVVSPEVKKYSRVADIITYQKNIVSEYKSAIKRFNANEVFNLAELDYLGRVYRQLFDQSMDHLEELAMVMTSSQLRMNDSERLAAIDRMFLNMQDKLAFLRDFNSKATALSMAREKQKSALKALGKIYQ